jgi:ankyrin repeat protein
MGATALILAATAGRANIVELLLARKEVEVNIQSKVTICVQ